MRRMLIYLYEIDTLEQYMIHIVFYNNPKMSCFVVKSPDKISLIL